MSGTTALFLGFALRSAGSAPTHQAKHMHYTASKAHKNVQMYKMSSLERSLVREAKVVIGFVLFHVFEKLKK